MQLHKLALAILVTVGAASCSSAPPTQPTTDAAIGTYILKTVNSVVMPVQKTPTTMITDGTIFISSDGTYSSTVHQTVTQNGTSTTSVIGLASGSWARLSDRTLRLTPVAGPELEVIGVVELPALYFTTDGVLYAYVKQ